MMKRDENEIQDVNMKGENQHVHVSASYKHNLENMQNILQWFKIETAECLKNIDENRERNEQ